MTVNEVNEQIRSLNEDVKSGKVKADDGIKKLEELRTLKEAAVKAEAEASHPMETREQKIVASYREIKNALMEKRAVTIGSNGNINQVKDIVKVLTAKTPLLNGVRKFIGANASTNIPILTAYPVVNGATEGATGLTADTAAAYSTKMITPHAFVSILPITAEALKMGTIDFETEAPQLFADAFANTFHNEILTGDGTGVNFSGVFAGVPAANKTNSAAVGKIAISDLAGLALKIQDKTDTAVLIMSPTVYAGFMADTSTDETTKLYKEELIRNKSIEGVKVMLTSSCPSSVATGATVVVAMDLNNYGLGLAGEIEIEPVKVLGDTKTYFQATAFANGTVINDKNVYSLVVA